MLSEKSLSWGDLVSWFEGAGSTSCHLKAQYYGSEHAITVLIMLPIHLSAYCEGFWSNMNHLLCHNFPSANVWSSVIYLFPLLKVYPFHDDYVLHFVLHFVCVLHFSHLPPTCRDTKPNQIFSLSMSLPFFKSQSFCISKCVHHQGCMVVFKIHITVSLNCHTPVNKQNIC